MLTIKFKILVFVFSILFVNNALSMSVGEKKQIFLDKVLPVVQKVHASLKVRYEEIQLTMDNNTNLERINSLKKKYRVKSDAELLRALKPFPISIALSQAAIESGWGTSRFFREANNVFGVWAFGENTPRIAANSKRDGKTIWVKKYDSIEESIKDYYLNLGRSFAFVGFRELNMTSNNPYSLVVELKMYSEKREVYSEELASIIRYNKFHKYDKIKKSIHTNNTRYTHKQHTISQDKLNSLKP